MKMPSVTLVGAGCGPGLITVKGLAALRQAEVLVYDDLIDNALLEEVPENTEKIYVGKRSGRKSMGQDEINSILIKEARKGRRVVRLKGGDSFVFGRGGEECMALREAGISCSVVPGISSAIAVPEHAGIPLTHRGLSRAFTVLTGKTADGSSIDLKALAHSSGTLVFLMGMRELPRIAAGLVHSGLPPDTPAAVISSGFSPEETRINGTLENIADRAENANTPAVIVIGDVAAFDLRCRDTAMSRSAPLPNRPSSACDIKAKQRPPRVTVTGTQRFVRHAAANLAEINAETIPLQTLRTEAIPAEYPDDLSAYSWIVFTSAAGVTLFFEELKRRRKDLRTLSGILFACIGPETAKVLAEHGVYADLVPKRFTSGALGLEIVERMHAAGTAEGFHEISHSKSHETSQGPRIKGQAVPDQAAAWRVLLLRSENGSRDLPDILTHSGIAFDEIKTYRTVPCEFALPLPPCDYLVFGSAGGVRAFADGGGFSGDEAKKCVFVCIGENTAEELKKHTSRSFITAEEATANSIAHAVDEDWRKNHVSARAASANP